MSDVFFIDSQQLTLRKHLTEIVLSTSFNYLKIKALTFLLSFITSTLQTENDAKRVHFAESLHLGVWLDASIVFYKQMAVSNMWLLFFVIISFSVKK